MRVRAKQVGYYDDVLREVGSVFEVPDGSEAKWFDPVPDDEPDEPEEKPSRSRGKRT